MYLTCFYLLLFVKLESIGILISHFFQAIGWDLSAFPNTQRWYKECANLPGFAENEEGAKQFGEAVKKNLKQ